ncbi:hypothetical protein D3C84_1121140 [compost metagenome]
MAIGLLIQSSLSSLRAKSVLRAHGVVQLAFTENVRDGDLNKLLVILRAPSNLPSFAGILDQLNCYRSFRGGDVATASRCNRTSTTRTDDRRPAVA